MASKKEWQKVFKKPGRVHNNKRPRLKPGPVPYNAHEKNSEIIFWGMDERRVTKLSGSLYMAIDKNMDGK